MCHDETPAHANYSDTTPEDAVAVILRDGGVIVEGGSSARSVHLENGADSAGRNRPERPRY